AAFSPGNTVPGTGISPDKMLMARTISYGDAHRARIGVNHNQIPVNAPKCPMSSYTKGGQMRIANTCDPVYAPNSKGGSVADPDANAGAESWHADGTLVRSAYTLRKDDDDFSQANALVNKVMDDAQRDRLVGNVTGALDGVSEPVLERAIEYWKNIDATIGGRIEKAVRNK